MPLIQHISESCYKQVVVDRMHYLPEIGRHANVIGKPKAIGKMTDSAIPK